MYDLMRNVLGFERFGAQGGDYGAFTATRLGIAHPGPLVGIHLNFLVLRRDLSVPAKPSPEERAYFDDLARFTKMEIGYQQIQGAAMEQPDALAADITVRRRRVADVSDRRTTRARRWRHCVGFSGAVEGLLAHFHCGIVTTYTLEVGTAADVDDRGSFLFRTSGSVLSDP
jgi:hypothetical protein